MKYVYAIHDRIAKELVGLSIYMLFCFRTDQQAIRYFADATFDEKSILSKHPADYQLVCLGELHQSEDGEVLLSNGTHRIVITGDALVATTSPQLVKES